MNKFNFLISVILLEEYVTLADLLDILRFILDLLLFNFNIIVGLIGLILNVLVLYKKHKRYKNRPSNRK